jgi:hypothetical protein
MVSSACQAVSAHLAIAGGIELLAAPSMTLSTLVPLSGLPSIGFAFQSYDQIWAAMDGGVGDVVRDAIGKAGIVPMKKIWDNGFRQITSSSSRQLNSVEDLRGFKIRVPVTALLTSLLSGSPPANNFPIIVDLIPGLQFRYSGGGTTIAQAAVTDVRGHPLPEIMRELIFDPLALENTTFAQPLPVDLAARSATAHPWNGVPMPGRWRVHPEMAAAGLWTTAGDLARIGCAFLDTLRGDHSTLGLSHESSAAMLKPQLPTDLKGGDFG